MRRNVQYQKENIKLVSSRRKTYMAVYLIKLKNKNIVYANINKLITKENMFINVVKRVLEKHFLCASSTQYFFVHF